jgi:hypothetical protein
MPLGRLDGYLIVSDLTGVRDILSRLRPILRSLVPWHTADERVKQLKPWVRVVVSSYVLVLIPVMLLAIALMVLHAPRAFATAYDSLAVQWDKVTATFGDDDIVRGLAGSLQVVALVTPCAGMTATTARLGRRAGAAALAWTAGRPLRQALLASTAGGALLVAAFTWWPNGDYRPIQSGERGTVQSGLRNMAHVSSGRPALTVEREQELGGAPSLRDEGDRPRLREDEPTGPNTDRREAGDPWRGEPDEPVPSDSLAPSEQPAHGEAPAPRRAAGPRGRNAPAGGICPAGGAGTAGDAGPRKPTVRGRTRRDPPSAGARRGHHDGDATSDRNHHDPSGDGNHPIAPLPTRLIRREPHRSGSACVAEPRRDRNVAYHQTTRGRGVTVAQEPSKLSVPVRVRSPALSAADPPLSLS